MEIGTTNLLSDPATSLTRCGATSPTNPRIPVNATIAAVMTDISTRQTVLNLLTSRPRLIALDSPRDMTLSFLERIMMITEPTTVTAAMMYRELHPMPSRLPICHMYALLSVSASVETIMYVTMELKK